MVKKIVIIGSESTGKSEMTQYLAKHFQCDWVSEYARTYLNQLSRPYNYDDLSEIAKGQISLENIKTKEAEKLLFIDTNLEVIKVWSENSFDKCADFILQQIAMQHYDYYLLMDIDLPWQEDPMREHPLPEQRQYFFNIYKDIVIHSGIPFSIISGLEAARFSNGVKAVEEFLEKL